KQWTKEEVVRVHEDDDRRWQQLRDSDVLAWASFPWPMLRKPQRVEELTYDAVHTYVLNRYAPGQKSDRDRIKENLRRWHPDRFETKFLPKVKEGDRERVREAAGTVARLLNEMLTRESTEGF
ncbi:hypothetical protein K474DRAFT_1595698, partial [Panus rudis PR-1116 ss-1]